MFPLNTDIDISILTGKVLESITFGPYQTILNFSESVSISIEDAFSVVIEGIEHQFPSPNSKNKTNPYVNLMLLVGEEVSYAKMSLERFAEIRYGSYAVMKLFATNAQYESFSISAPGICIVA